MWKTTSRSANRSAQRKYRATAAARSPAAPAEACPRRVSSAPRPVSSASAASSSAVAGLNQCSAMLRTCPPPPLGSRSSHSQL